jgi:hypothetical protein
MSRFLFFGKNLHAFLRPNDVDVKMQTNENYVSAPLGRRNDVDLTALA